MGKEMIAVALNECPALPGLVSRRYFTIVARHNPSGSGHAHRILGPSVSTARSKRVKY